MATNPAPTQDAPGAQADVPLWAAPAFVLGVGALVAVCLCRPIFRDSEARQVARDLRAAREMVKRADPDLDEVVRLTRRALDRAEAVPNSAGEASLLLGIAQVCLAEKAEGDRARQLWEQARESLERADSLGVSEDDRTALVYRLAKAGFHTGDAPEKVIARLEECAEGVQDRADAYDLLTRAYLGLATPNFERALDANKRHRDVPALGTADLAHAQLTGSEILLRMGKPAEAAPSLKLIVEEKQAPPAVLVRARLLLARCHQDDRRFDQAVALYQAALADGRASIPRQAEVYYNLGLCYQELGQPKEAAAAWEKCARLAQDKESEAAWIVLAELRLLDPKLDGVLDALGKAVASVESPERWKNPLVDLPRARKVFERAVDSFRKAGRPEDALQALEPYARLAAPRRLLEWRGVVSAEVARARKAKGDPRAEPESAGLFKQAADAYGQAAELKDLKPAEAADFLWAAVPCHLSAGEGGKAVEKLERLTRMELDPARMGEAWYLLGEEYRGGKEGKKAEAAYRECMKYATRFEYLARYQLAMLLLAAGDLDEAIAALKNNIVGLRFDTDNEALSQSLLALGGILYRRGGNNFRDAARNLEDGLARSKTRDKADLAQARFQLADSYRQIASQENMSLILKGDSASPEARAHFQKEHRDWLNKAAEEFATLDTFLDSAEGKDCLTGEQRSQVPFITAKCWFNLGQYDKALKIYDRLVERYKGKPEGLDALGGAVSCHAALGQVGNVRQRLLEIKMALPSFPKEIREPWEEWLKEAEKGLKDI